MPSLAEIKASLASHRRGRVHRETRCVQLEFLLAEHDSLISEVERLQKEIAALERLRDRLEDA